MIVLSYNFKTSQFTIWDITKKPVNRESLSNYCFMTWIQRLLKWIICIATIHFNTTSYSGCLYLYRKLTEGGWISIDGSSSDNTSFVGACSAVVFGFLLHNWFLYRRPMQAELLRPWPCLLRLPGIYYPQCNMLTCTTNQLILNKTHPIINMYPNMQWQNNQYYDII